MKRRNQWKKFSAVLLSMALTIPGMASYAASPEHDGYGGCYSQIIAGTGETWSETEEIILPEGMANRAYSHSLSFESCGLTPVKWSLEEDAALPSGLTLSAGGKLSGTPKESGTYQFPVMVELGTEGKIASPSDAHPGNWDNEQYMTSHAVYQITIQPAQDDNQGSGDDGNGSDSGDNSDNNNSSDNNNNNNSSHSSSSSSGSAAAIQKTGWYLDAAADWYYYSSYNVLHKGWLLDPQDHFWYYLDLTTGKMCTGWNEIDGKWYYFNPESPIYTWEKRGEDWFFKGIEGSRPKGSMYSGEMTPDGRQVEEDGARID